MSCFGRGRALALVSSLVFAGCFVPDLRELEQELMRRCDAQHACAEGYDCVGVGVGVGGGECQVQAGVACTPGEVVWCGLGVGECYKGERSCGDDGRFGECGAWFGLKHEQAESSCDGIDNDCDGRTDALTDRFYAPEHGFPSNQRTWVATATGFCAFTSDRREGFSKVYVQRFNSDLEPVDSEAEASFSADKAVESGLISAAKLGDAAVIVWADRTADGVHRAVIGRADDRGRMLWQSNGPTAYYIKSDAAPVDETAVAVTVGEQYVLGMWRSGPSVLSGNVLRADDGQRVSLTPITIATAGAGEEIFEMSAVGRADSFIVAWASRTAGAYRIQIGELSTHLEFIRSIETIDAAGPVSSLTLARRGLEGDAFSLFWIEEQTPGEFVISSVDGPDGLATPAVLHGPTSEPLGGLTATTTSRGPLVAWSQGASVTRIYARTPTGLITPSSPPDLARAYRPALAWDPAQDQYWVSYEVLKEATLYFYRTRACSL